MSDSAMTAKETLGQPRSRTITWHDPLATATVGAGMSGYARDVWRKRLDIAFGRARPRFQRNRITGWAIPTCGVGSLAAMAGRVDASGAA